MLLLFVADVELVRKTWKGLLDTRNQYRRRGKLLKSGSGYSKHKQWSLAAAMSWLDKYNEPPRYSYFVGRRDYVCEKYLLSLAQK